MYLLCIGIREAGIERTEQRILKSERREEAARVVLEDRICKIGKFKTETSWCALTEIEPVFHANVE